MIKHDDVVAPTWLRLTFVLSDQFTFDSRRHCSRTRASRPRCDRKPLPASHSTPDRWVHNSIERSCDHQLPSSNLLLQITNCVLNWVVAIFDADN